ncbi:histone acetyltransferase MYST2 [Nematocida parisii]|nr:histone acetyltransferase MYST2 [Nematocida parisii]KAI5130601.1 histone acetyltransferase MYST2 [Nematocida parisii]KAI5144086.1 histone acetyltransferase MYST2 [Nematocida parisii]
MKCNKCQNTIGIQENIKEKIELLGTEDLFMFCESCRVCYICYTKSSEVLEYCKMCGYSYHVHHCTRTQTEKANGNPEERVDGCEKCTELLKGVKFDGLLGPEIPALERSTEEISKDVSKKVCDIIKKNRPGKNSEGIQKVFLGEVELTPLFSSPYPEEYVKHRNLFICSKCMEYFSTKYSMDRHQSKCMMEYPPGRLLYLDNDETVIFEVEGEKEQKYCQSLCLLAKMFLDHKTLYYDVESFLFYIVGEVKDNVFHMQGYFSKEKGEGRNNLSCIVVFPAYQKLGIGSFLIDFSYYLTKTTGTVPYIAGPEQPLSSDGERAYLSYWTNAILRYIMDKKNFTSEDHTFEKISEYTGVSKDNIKSAYKQLVKRFNKELTYHDFISNRDIVKRTRRIKKGASVQKSVECNTDHPEDTKIIHSELPQNIPNIN